MNRARGTNALRAAAIVTGLCAVALSGDACGNARVGAAAKILAAGSADPIQFRRESLDKFDEMLGRTRCWCCKETLKSCYVKTLQNAGCPPG